MAKSLCDRAAFPDSWRRWCSPARDLEPASHACLGGELPALLCELETAIADLPPNDFTWWASGPYPTIINTGVVVTPHGSYRRHTHRRPDGETLSREVSRN
ncbi:hypothetical protein NDU88_007561 [Pleurodeles waltl]|uniref:Uncharacterized protein n=1 Tax=Pleurodeles waltl TaxID=8319 RepID=A0AAV7N2G2_PLEWA|nr:hypothetical protein NDU88_007561 [Pleurodeles waltl]